MKYRPVYDEEGRLKDSGFVSDYDRGGYRESEPEGGFVSEEPDPFCEETAAAEHEEKLARRAEHKAKKQRKKNLRTALIAVLFVLLGGLFLFGRWAHPPAVNREMTEQTSEDVYRRSTDRRKGC